MSETSVRSLKQLIRSLCPSDFQYFCHLCLKDQGYRCTPGPIPGRDGGHDIYGNGVHGTFVAHCTTTTTNLRRKMIRDLCASVSQCVDHEAPKQHLLFISTEPLRLTPPEKQTFIENDVIPQLVAIEPRYLDKAPGVETLSADELARWVEFSSARSDAMRFLKSRSADIFGSDHLIDDDLSVTRAAIDHSAHRVLPRLLDRYSPHLPHPVKKQLVEDILQHAWNEIAFDPYYAASILDNPNIVPNSLQPAIMPVCKIGAAAKLSSTDVTHFLVAMDRLSAFSAPNDATVLQVYTTRMIRFLSYAQPEALESEDACLLIESLENNQGAFWQSFLVDLFYRHECLYINLPSRILKSTMTAFARLSNRGPSPLLRLSPFIREPYNYFKNNDGQAFEATLCEIASQCRSTLESRWCATALLRVAPLYEVSDEDDSRFELILRFVNSFRRDIYQKCCQLQILRLSSCLDCFQRTKEIQRLREFEEEFRAAAKLLPPPQMTHMQIEYAAAVYRACEMFSDETVRELTIWTMASARRPIVDTYLFSNPLLTRESHANVPAASRGFIMKWLREYTIKLIELHAMPRISMDHCVALSFRMCRHVYAFRPLLVNSVTASVASMRERVAEARGAYCARSTAIFPLCARNKLEDVMAAVTERAVNLADQYHLLRNATGIFNSLYHAFYYGPVESRKHVGELAEKLAEKTGVGEGIPRLHWMYFAGIQHSIRATEKMFIDEILPVTNVCETESGRLDVQDWERVRVEFDSALPAIVRRCRDAGSLFAAVVEAAMLDAEVWNILGTTAVNVAGYGDVRHLRFAASCYDYAKCFSRESVRCDVKYCYNALRCRSLAYLVSEERAGGRFIADAARWLARPLSSCFGSRAECVRPFLRLLLREQETMSRDSRREVEEMLRRSHWVRDQLNAERPTAGNEL